MHCPRFSFAVFIAVLSLFAGLAVAAAQVRDFRVGSLVVKPGETASGYLDVPKKGDEGTVIPVLVVHGTRPGPVLACVAGVHGYEYPPILALYKLKGQIDPRKLSGTLLLVPIANVPSFAKRTIYYNPSDWKNLNRVFPGSLNGSLSERMAYILNEEIIGRCDDLIDLHGGDGNEALMPYTYWMVGPDAQLNAKSRELALAFGLRHIIIDATRSQTLADSIYLANTAVLRGKPAITTETGALGRTDDSYIRMAEAGVTGVMRHLGMIEGPAEPARETVWIDDYKVLNSGATGLFTPLAKMGDSVVQGQRVGFVSDYLGRPAENVIAPFDGLVLYIIGTPPISRASP